MAKFNSPDQDKTVWVNDRKLIFDHFFQIEEARLQHELFEGGMSPEIHRLNLIRGNSAAAIIYQPYAGKVILIEQFRFPTYDQTGGWITEIVAGRIEEGETADVCIRREIIEETGFKVDVVEPICEFYASPGGSSERIFLFYAEVNESDQGDEHGHNDHEEDIKILKWNPGDLREKLRTNQLQDAKTIIAAHFFLNRINKEI